MISYKDLYNIINDSIDDYARVEKLIEAIDELSDLYDDEVRKRKYFEGCYNAVRHLGESEE